ncbi:MAG: hypothetical protein FWD34_06235 [Oscillospiraceae bacterium]|nr:hypothetical protein [Oscillospiraceae bacterium]
MNIDAMTAGMHFDMNPKNIGNAVSARLLSKAIAQSYTHAAFIEQALPKAGRNEIGGLMDFRA